MGSESFIFIENDNFGFSSFVRNALVVMIDKYFVVGARSSANLEDVL